MAEICVESVQSAVAAEKGGAQRVELCAGLSEGGTTPSAGMIELTRKSINIGLHVLIRPRRGDFLYSDSEFAIMKKDIEVAKALGVDGIVIGILQADGNIDKERMRELINLSYPLSVTFHRAFDMTPDPFSALEDLLELKVPRLLTSGQQETALQGAALIRDLIQKAGKRIVVMPGSGINETNVGELLAKTGAKEFHTSARLTTASQMAFRRNDLAMAVTPPLSEYALQVADENKIRAIRQAAEAST